MCFHFIEVQKLAELTLWGRSQDNSRITLGERRGHKGIPDTSGVPAVFVVAQACDNSLG